MILIDDPLHGDRIDATKSMYPSDLIALKTSWYDNDQARTVYGFVVTGAATVDLDGMRAVLKAGDYFVCPDKLEVQPHPDSLVVVIRRFGFRGMIQLGRIEQRGRLSYIDGCSDTLLVMPPRLGDPCFNHLHFPPTIVQTQHTHPSIRLGMVIGGAGTAFGPGWEKPLLPGAVFLLEEQELHSFRTDKPTRKRTPEEVEAFMIANPEYDVEYISSERLPMTPVGMDVIAFHPDSDWGPTDQAHPMRNRTYLGTDGI